MKWSVLVYIRMMKARWLREHRLFYRVGYTKTVSAGRELKFKRGSRKGSWFSTIRQALACVPVKMTPALTRSNSESVRCEIPGSFVNKRQEFWNTELLNFSAAVNGQEPAVLPMTLSEVCKSAPIFS
jgi:hypothetical protein